VIPIQADHCDFRPAQSATIGANDKEWEIPSQEIHRGDGHTHTEQNTGKNPFGITLSEKGKQGCSLYGD
jgi:hypothetical protein